MALIMTLTYLFLQNKVKRPCGGKSQRGRTSQASLAYVERPKKIGYAQPTTDSLAYGPQIFDHSIVYVMG